MKLLPVLNLGLGHTDQPACVKSTSETAGLELEDLFHRRQAN